MEFYIEFIDLLGMELLRVAEDERTYIRMMYILNETFNSFNPKQDCLDYFDGFIPISLCNYLFKIIAKVIATRLNYIPSKYILDE